VPQAIGAIGVVAGGGSKARVSNLSYIVSSLLEATLRDEHWESKSSSEQLERLAETSDSAH